MDVTQTKPITSGFRLPKPRIRLIDLTLAMSAVDACTYITVSALTRDTPIPISSIAQFLLSNALSYTISVFLIIMVLSYLRYGSVTFKSTLTIYSKTLPKVTKQDIITLALPIFLLLLGMELLLNASILFTSFSAIPMMISAACKAIVHMYTLSLINTH